MKKLYFMAELILVALCGNGCATHALLHAVGLRQEDPANITQAWAQKDVLFIDYTAVITDGDGNCLKGYKPVDRQAVFDLSKRLYKNQYNIGQIQTNTPPIVFPTSDWTYVPRITGGVVTQETLGTNTLVIEGSQAGVFRVFRNPQPQTNDLQAIFCSLETRRWSLWWRRPAQVVGFPFACVIDAIVLPFNAIGWGIYSLQENAASNRHEN
jgi:hypothetical protein